MSSSRTAVGMPPMLASGSRVILVVSKGPAQVAPAAYVETPDVAGRPQGDALSSLQKAGLPVQVFNDYSPSHRRGSVIAQLPPAGASVPAGAQAALLVSSGAAPSQTAQVVLPDVSGMSEPQAVSAIQAAGLSPQLVHEHSRSVPEGVVIAQLPNKASLAAEPVSKIRPWMLAAAAAVVVAIIAIAFALFGGGSSRVPEVVGLPQDEAVAAIEDAGFVVGSVEGTESVAVAEGTVVVQDPAAGAELAEGGSVSIVVAGAPKTEAVPDVKGMTQARAVALVEEAGFEAKVTRRADVFVEKGLVIEQDPVGDAQATPGSTVTIVISEGPQPKEVEVPDVSGLARVDAERALRELGFAISVGQAASSDVALDVVISQLPKAGERLLEGSRVGIVISSGPPTAEAVAVPDVVGTMLTDAEQTLSDAGFQAVPSGSKGKGKPANQVIGQVPAAGEMAQPGSSVVIFYASEE